MIQVTYNNNVILDVDFETKDYYDNNKVEVAYKLQTYMSNVPEVNEEVLAEINAAAYGLCMILEHYGFDSDHISTAEVTPQILN